MQDWRCCDDRSETCPPEGCPVMYGCARARGWSESLEPPEGYRNLTPLENLVSRSPPDEMPDCIWRGAETPFADNY